MNKLLCLVFAAVFAAIVAALTGCGASTESHDPASLSVELTKLTWADPTVPSWQVTLQGPQGAQTATCATVCEPAISIPTATAELTAGEVAIVATPAGASEPYLDLPLQASAAGTYTQAHRVVTIEFVVQ